MNQLREPQQEPMNPDRQLKVGGFNLGTIQNRNEARIVAAMRALLERDDSFCGCRLCLEDVYALAMNQTPAHYVQSGAIVLGTRTPPDGEIERIVLGAMERVRTTPNHE